MFFLDHAWLVPLIPALSFVVILLFGKRMPRHGSEVGIVAVGASFVLACGALVQWIKRVQDADSARRRRASARSAAASAASAPRAARRRCCPSCTTSRGSRTAACGSPSASRSTASP